VPGAGDTAEANVWFVSFETNEGKKVTKKMTTDQVLAGIKGGGFKPSTQASRTQKGEYRALATYPEFSAPAHAAKTQRVATRRARSTASCTRRSSRRTRGGGAGGGCATCFPASAAFVGFLIWLAIVAAVVAGCSS